MEAWRTLYNTASSKKLVDSLPARTQEFTFAELWFALTMASKKWQLIPRNCNIMNKTWGFQLLNPKLGMLSKLPSYWNLHFTVWNTHTLQTLILRNDRRTYIQLHRTYCRLIRTDSNTFCNKIKTLCNHMVHTNSYKVVISSLWNPSCTLQKRTCSTKMAQFPTLETWA